MKPRLALAALSLLLVATPSQAGSDTHARVVSLKFTVLSLVFRTSGFGQEREESVGRVKIRLSADVLFAFSKATLSPRAKAVLADVASDIERRANGAVRLDGHTDSIGSFAYNQRLSERRAAAVRQALQRLVRSPRARFVARGHGETDPVAPNRKPNGSDNPSGRAKNRRVEVRFST